MPTTNSGIRTTSDGTSYIPASKRADGTTRKAIRVRPGFTPQEDIETYKSRTAEAWKNRGSAGVPGVDVSDQPNATADGKSKNAKRRDAIKRRQLAEASDEHQSGDKDGLVSSLEHVSMNGVDPVEETAQDRLASVPKTATETETEHDIERQKKIRNLLKKFAAVHDLKEKKAAGQKLSPDQLMKIGREEELLRDLKKLGYDGSELEQHSRSNKETEK